MSVRLDVDLQITPFFKNKHFELCCFVMYRVRNIVNRRESDVICHSVRRSRAPTSNIDSNIDQVPSTLVSLACHL
jgi:hypothetical protein